MRLESYTLYEKPENSMFKQPLVGEGIDASIIDASGEGESNPVADNSTSEGQALNRRGYCRARFYRAGRPRR